MPAFPGLSPFPFRRFRVRGAGKVPWTEADVRSMAIAIKQNLPVSVMQLLSGDAWKGGASYPTWGHRDIGTCRWRDPQPLLGWASGAKIQGSGAFPILSHWCFHLSSQDLHEQALDTFGGRGWCAEFGMQWGEENQVFDQWVARSMAQQYFGSIFMKPTSFYFVS